MTGPRLQLLESTVTREQLVAAMEATLAWVHEHPAEAAQRYAQSTYRGVARLGLVRSGMRYDSYDPYDEPIDYWPTA